MKIFPSTPTSTELSETTENVAKKSSHKRHKWAYSGALVAGVAGTVLMGGTAFADTGMTASSPDQSCRQKRGLSVLDGPEKAVDGKWSSVQNDKWCAEDGMPMELTISFGNMQTRVDGLTILHAGILEDDRYNTKGFKVEIKTGSRGTWQQIYSTNNNTADTTTIPTVGWWYQYAKITITDATQFGSQIARIYEVQKNVI